MLAVVGALDGGAVQAFVPALLVLAVLANGDAADMALAPVAVLAQKLGALVTVFPI